jgi:hypothetical protein
MKYLAVVAASVLSVVLWPFGYTAEVYKEVHNNTGSFWNWGILYKHERRSAGRVRIDIEKRL